jgi:hypothetical protein
MADRVVKRHINQITLFPAPEFVNLVVGCGGVCHLRVRGNTFFAIYIRKVLEDELPYVFGRWCAAHHLPALISGFFVGEKNIKFLFPANTEVNITHVNSLCKASNSLILMASNALVAICSIHLLPLAKF